MREFEVEIPNAVPEFVMKDQFTVVVCVILLPVVIKVNKTLDPAQMVS